MRVAFLFNHAVPHQVPHAAPFAFVLSRECPQLDVIIACSTSQELALPAILATTKRHIPPATHQGRREKKRT